MSKRILGAALLVAATSVAAQAPTLAPLAPPQTVKVAYVPIMKFATMYVAAKRGLFARHGLNVELERVKSGTEAIAFLTQGTIDVGGIAIVTSLWNSWNRGMDLRIIAPGALEPLQNSPTQLLVRAALANDGTVKTIADLKGRRVAVAGGPGSGGEYLLTKALQRANLTIRDVVTQNIANADMPRALESGGVDASLTGSPYTTQAVGSGAAKVLATDLTPGLMTVAFVSSGKFIQARPEAAQRFVVALAEAARLMQGDNYLAKENIEAYLTYTNSTEEAIRKGDPVVYDPDIVIPTAGLADIEAVHRVNGRTDYDTPLDLARIMDERFAKRAVQILGPYKR